MTRRTAPAVCAALLTAVGSAAKGKTVGFRWTGEFTPPDGERTVATMWRDPASAGA